MFTSKKIFWLGCWHRHGVTYRFRVHTYTYSRNMLGKISNLNQQISPNGVWSYRGVWMIAFTFRVVSHNLCVQRIRIKLFFFNERWHFWHSRSFFFFFFSVVLFLIKVACRRFVCVRSRVSCRYVYLYTLIAHMNVTCSSVLWTINAFCRTRLFRTVSAHRTTVTPTLVPEERRRARQQRSDGGPVLRLYTFRQLAHVLLL